MIAGIPYAWTAVYAALGAYFLLLGRGRRIGWDYLVFGALCVVDGAYAFDLDYRKGCALCVQECPAGAIKMEPEPI